MTIADLTREITEEINALNSNFRQFESYYGEHKSDWMHHRVHFFSSYCVYDCVSEFRSGVIRINNLVEKLKRNNPNLIQLNPPTNFYCTYNIFNQSEFGATILDHYSLINENSIKLYNQIHPNARKWTRQDYKNCESCFYVTLISCVVALCAFGAYFFKLPKLN